MGFTGAHMLYVLDVFILALYLLSHVCALLEYTFNFFFLFIGAVWTKAFLEMEGEQTCYLKTLTLVRHRGPTTRIIMQVSSRKAKKVQNKKLRQ